MTKSFNLGVVHMTSPHLLADLAELAITVKYSEFDELSHMQLLDIAREQPVADDEVDEDVNENEALDDEEKKSRQYRRIEDCWAQLEYRAGIFKQYYPFVIDGDRLKRRKKITDKHKLYMFLLICSRLRSFHPRFSSKAATEFVQISAVALKSLVGPSTDVRIFDANSVDRKNYYGTDLRKALKRLSEDLAPFITHDAVINAASSSGDADIDLVAIRSFLDSAHGSHALFGQCAAREKDWPQKTLEASYAKVQTFFQLLHDPANLVFIPHCFRTSSGSWANEAKTGGCLLIDRVRLIALIKTVGAKGKGAIASCGAMVDEVVA